MLVSNDLLHINHELLGIGELLTVHGLKSERVLY